MLKGSFRRCIAAAVAAAALASLAVLRPAQTPAAGDALAYDEIVKLAVNASPAPPGAFGTDYAAIVTPAATAAPKKRGLFSGLNVGSIAQGIAGGSLSGDPGGAMSGAAGSATNTAVSNAVANMLDRSLAPMVAGLQRFQNGLLERHAFYNGWERTDDVAANTATILKCAQHQRITLDLARHTYLIDDPAAPVAAESAAPASRAHTCPATSPPERPGSGTFTITSRTSALGALPIDGTATTGYRATNTLALTGATGSCKNGTFSVDQTAYYSAYDVPRAYCPLRREARPVPAAPEDMVARPSGCRLTSAFRRSGPTLPSAKLALYDVMTMTASDSAAPEGAQASARGFAVAIERGHVRRLGPADASLFEVPPGFTAAK